MTTFAPSSPPASAQSAPRPKIHGVLAEFHDPASLLHAAEKVREAGYRWWDCHTPFPVHGLDKAMGIQRTILPLLVFGAGLTGTTVGFILQAFTNATSISVWALVWVTGYPFLISGKPLISLPAFIPVMFELTILLAATSCVGLMLLLNGLPWLSHPLLANKRFLRATDDRFFIVIQSRDPRFFRSRTEDFLKGLGAKAVEAVEA
ncbi:MAG: DUF3341 domain-containing protein [Planctomycetes bacterium]|nr:DUF3341 domain-containing protein [Planctomycetota bacterium]